jgi:hypothetical protein
VRCDDGHRFLEAAKILYISVPTVSLRPRHTRGNEILTIWYANDLSLTSVTITGGSGIVFANDTAPTMEFRRQSAAFSITTL